MKHRVELLNSSHEKKNFCCGIDLLDNYIKTQAKQDVNHDLSACYVLKSDSDKVLGYYTLSASSVNLFDFPEEMRRNLPASYKLLPTILLGRFAIDKSIQGKGFGNELLVNALKRCLEISESLGSIAVIVDPVDEKAEIFYAKYGFVSLPGTGKMHISTKTISKIVGL